RFAARHRRLRRSEKSYRAGRGPHLHREPPARDRRRPAAHSAVARRNHPHAERRDDRTMFIVERSRGTGLGDIRDVGASANGLTPGGLEYHVGLFNETGESQGTTDTNDQKAVVARAAYHPSFFPAFQIGGSGAFEGGPTPQRRERAGGELQYRDTRLTLRGEAMTARDGELRRFGWYGLGAFRPVPAIQLVARWDEWDRDRAAESAVTNAFERQIVAGASYTLDGNVTRLVLNVVRQTFPNISSVPNATFALVAFEALW